MMKSILLIAGTRPNFIKLAPLFHKLIDVEDSIQVKTCHTGQHFDSNMSDVFWNALELPEPDYMLNIRGDDVPDIIGKTILGVNDVIKKENFDLIIVFGDVNATVSGAIVAVQSNIKVMHVEAGLRSFDKRMPEETNRIITDHISDYLMVSEPSGIENLNNEGIQPDKIFYVGNIMIECLIKTEAKWKNVVFNEEVSAITNKPFIICTFHRPENVDHKEDLEQLVEVVNEISKHDMVIFPVHPRTGKKLKDFNLMKDLASNTNLALTEPLPYFEFMKLLSLCKCVITDSGGIQEESSHFGKPCITLRENTERPVTVTAGTNKLLHIRDKKLIENIYIHIDSVLGHRNDGIELWDEEVSNRIIEVILKKI
jgi:UDP-N-acetylglucosamine 2-epimerase (non-hydrolysing)